MNSVETSTNTKKKLLFVLRHSPYGSSLAKEGIDAILATSVYEQALSVLFIDDGVFQLSKQQNSNKIGEKNIYKLLSAFELYDIDALFACSDSLLERGLHATTIFDNVTIINNTEIKQLFSQQHHLLSF